MLRNSESLRKKLSLHNYEKLNNPSFKSYMGNESPPLSV